MRSSKQAFTLVELLVVVAIIGVLVALLLPAVQSAREAARRSQCLNNMKQFGLAFHQYHDTFQVFPLQGMPLWNANGGRTWGWGAVLLPFIEQKALSRCLEARRPGLAPSRHADRRRAALAAARRRPFVARPTAAPRQIRSIPIRTTPANPNDQYSTSNYAPNQNVVHHNVDGTGGRGMRIITDGTSNTLLMAERSLRLEPQSHPPHGRDRLGPLAGHRRGELLPRQLAHQHTQPQQRLPCRLRRRRRCRAHIASSAHPGGALFAMCDGSARFVSENIAVNPSANHCTGSNTMNCCGPGFVYQNLYQPDDGFPIAIGLARRTNGGVCLWSPARRSMHCRSVLTGCSRQEYSGHQAVSAVG